jgi:acetylornithine deacetylase
MRGAGDPVELLRRLARIDSRNPSLCAGASGESEVAHALAETLKSWGMDARLMEALPGRPNVVATVRGTGRGRSLMLNGHLDVVGIESMTHPAFDGHERAGRLYARGASDMKGGVAAMCAAAARLRGELAGDVVIAAVVDEEWQSHGTAALLRSGVRADAAIVTEPTSLRMMPAHKGFVWIEIEVHGRAAHGSRWDLGQDAVRFGAHVMVELDSLDRDVLPKRTHRLLGRPSLHVGTVEGGTGLSTYPDRCVIRVERRTIPGESTESAMKETTDACARVRARYPEFRADVRVLFAQPPSDVSTEAPLVQTLATTLQRHGLDAKPVGMSAWTDAALLNVAGIPTICFGPGDMGLAHAAEEYIELKEVERATEILVDFAREWCSEKAGADA